MNRRRNFRLQFHPPVEIRMVEIRIRRGNQLVGQARIRELAAIAWSEAIRNRFAGVVPR